MRKSVAAAIIAASAATSACGHSREDEDAGATVSRNYQIGNFQAIEVAGPYDVEVRTGAKPGVSAQGSEKLLERTAVEVRGDKLLIRPEEHRGWFHFGWSSHGKAHFTVTVPQLREATIAGSGDIKVDKVQGDRFEGTVAGSGGINVAAMDVQSLKLSIAGSGGVKAGTGKARSAEYEIAGSGDVDAGSVQTQQVKVSIAGSGGIRAHSSGTADVDIMGSGDVDISGGAKCNVSKNGSGDVRCS
jgi:putative autotransporter adhesin-like protein